MRSRRIRLAALPLLVAATLAASAVAPPVELTSEQDHRRLLDLLHITSLRPGANGRDPQAPNAANYDESKANPYATLPDPLVLKNGRKVTTAETWWKERRPEIVEDFDREIYGRMPKNVPAVRWEVTGTTSDTTAGVPVTVKKLLGHVDNSAYPAVTVDIDLTLTTPSRTTGPVPVVLELAFNFAGRQPPLSPPPVVGPTWQEQVLARGWGYATLYPTSAQADNGAGLTRGIIGLVNRGQPRTPSDWGALRAWGWGASRVLDYFETDRAVDARRVAIEGHSRYGKAALVAMADDPRFAIGFISSSGEGGAKLHRRNWGEIVENVAGSGEYHWMAGNFLKYAGPLGWNDLPVDSHELIALCAPRPVFISSGSSTAGDAWVDAKGMFLAAAGAGPVYRLLGKKDMGTAELPPIETALVDGEVAFRQHADGHTPGPNWPTFLTFADRYIQSPVARPRVALTFDDLPIHSTLPPGKTRSDIARSIIATLQAAKAPPTYGFVNAKGLQDAPETADFLRIWRAAGHPLANHAFSHMDLHRNTAEAFGQDILAGEPALRAAMGDEDWHWFRYPYLREGDTLEKRHAVSAFLKERGYKVAEVTLSFDDYAYNDPYARCLARGDDAGIDWLKESYLTRAADSLSRGQDEARELFGRDIAHVLLLHVGGFQMVMLPRLMDLLREERFTLVTLPEAQGDPAYAADSDVATSGGATLLGRVRRARRMPPAPSSDDFFERIGAICR